MKKIHLLIVAIIVLVFVGVMISMWRGPEPVERVEVEEALEEDQLIGGQTDEYGCLGPAGYGYDAEIGACIRVWELDEDARRAAQLAVAEVPWVMGLTVVEVAQLKCFGCYEVTLEIGETHPKEQMNISISNWEVTK